MSTLAGSAYHPINGAAEDIWEGFSWPALFLGFIWFIYKGMWGWGVIAFILALSTFGISWLFFPFFANELYAKSLLGQGYLNAKQWNEKKQVNAGTIKPALQPQQGGSLIADELAKLVALKERGVLSNEEFNKQKQKLLN